MNRGLLSRALRIALTVSTVLGLSVTGWLAWRRPDHVVAWLTLMPLCGP
ncbi:hypothetical protein [Variovorax sp. YR752]